MGELSPMMRQYLDIKAQNEDSILFFRVGDFYEMFFDDAAKASDELDLVLTGKDCGLEKRAPMCGVPFHSCEAYIARLVEKGHKVAICEQTENPAEAKGLVKRDIVRIITPGTVIEDSMLDEGRNNYLCALAFFKKESAMAFTDASTGECYATILPADNTEKHIIDEFSRFRPKELLITKESLKALPHFSALLEDSFGSVAVTEREASSFDTANTENRILSYFGVNSTENMGFVSGSAVSSALGAILEYILETGVNGRISIKNVEIYTESQYMRLDMTAVRNLELIETMRTKAKRGTLLWVIDKTKTAMGKRQLSSWLTKPLMNITQINLRQNAIEELFSNTIMRGEITEYLSGVKDIERIMTKVVYGSAKAQDLISISQTAERLPALKSLVSDAKCKMLKGIYADIDVLEDIKTLIDASINEKAPNNLREGGLIKDGYNAELDEIRRDMNGGTELLTVIEAREKERTGIKNLKVRYNKVFGYYIEVTNSFKDLVPEDYIRKQTLTNAERFITEELKEIEKRVLSAKDRVVQFEYELFDEIRKSIAGQLERFRKTSAAIAALDAICSLSNIAAQNNYCRPLINNSGVITIKEGRHPVVEQMIKTPFVANDTFLNMKEGRCAIITGPNMAGKSTYMRQVALIVLLAQIGSFVPAQSAEIGLVDAIFTRVGASDDLASGQSTFMVEMTEVADILKNATKQSLLILDEIGRGTSTFDGMSIARAVLEYVADNRRLGAKALFATHYHELTQMENEFGCIINYNIAVKKRGDNITFLRRIVRGSADDSYGIEVAALSGIPAWVTERAKEILKTVETEGLVSYKQVADGSPQLSLEMQAMGEILADLKAIDVNTLTPIESMQLLFDICNKAKSL